MSTVIDCSICLEDMEDTTIESKLECGHIFHKECISKWTVKNNNCPLCRSYIKVSHCIQDLGSISFLNETNVLYKVLHQNEDRKTIYFLEKRYINMIINQTCNTDIYLVILYFIKNDLDIVDTIFDLCSRFY